MAVVSTNQVWLNSNSGFSFFDFSWFLEAVATNANQGTGIESPLLKAGSVLECDGTVVDIENESDAAIAVENRCQEGGDVAFGSDVGSKSTGIEIAQEDKSGLETSELRRMFQTFDENQDGFICAADLRQFMSRLGFGISEDESVSMVATVDHDGDGNVGFEEFCSLYRSLDECLDSCTAGESEVDDEETLLEAFCIFDKNNDGFISCQELQSVLLALGLPEGKSLKSCELMIQGVDSDGNGEVDIQEFKRMMSSNCLLR